MGLVIFDKLRESWLTAMGGTVKLTSQLTLIGANDRTLEYDPPLWEDLRFPAQSLKLSGTKPPSWTAFKGSYVLAFSDQAVIGNEEYIYFTAQVPHAYATGEDIEVHVHWTGEDATAGNVRWRFTYSWANIGDQFPAEAPIYVNAANGGALADHNYGEFGNITGTSKGISSMLLCSLSRNSSDALDTFNGKDAYLLEIDFHIPVNTLGSRQEAVK